ncbi:MAG: hypothetical protein ACR2OB_12990 [Solirubrobacteraceae bacterium]
MRVKNLILPGVAVFALAGSAQASTALAKPRPTRPAHRASKPARTSTRAPKLTSDTTGGAGIGYPTSMPSTPAHPIVPGAVAEVINGIAYAPSLAPPGVQRAIWAGNAIRHKPYVYGGGHGSFHDSGYDCSGSVSYLLHAAGLLQSPLASGDFMSWDRRGQGRWITVYANPAHAFIEIAGIRMDTSAQDDPNPPPGSGPRWRGLVSETSAYDARHPSGY